MGAIYWGAEYIFMENPAVETMIRNMKKISSIHIYQYSQKMDSAI